jgi:hypothetical protein
MTRTHNFNTITKMLPLKRLTTVASKHDDYKYEARRENAFKKCRAKLPLHEVMHVYDDGMDVLDSLVVPMMCSFAHMRNGCVRVGCRFCHSDEQLARVYKTRPCFSFIKSGRCPRGDTCGYTHPSPVLGISNAATSGPTIPAMCYHVLNVGTCPTGGQCVFCHDFVELARIYKTLPCANFSQCGWCERGDMCGFIHGPDDLAAAAQPDGTAAFSFFYGLSRGCGGPVVAAAAAHTQYELFGGHDHLRPMRCACA